jgi:hypothetical protein
MPNFVNNFAKIDTVLASAVANAGTFDVAYPTGYSQGSFQNGLYKSATSYMIVNGNDRWDNTKFSASFGASLITITNSTGATLAAGSTISINLDVQDGNLIEILSFPVVSMASITGSIDVVTDYPLGFDGSFESIAWLQSAPVTTAAKLASLNLEIGTVNVTGGVVALTSALCTPLGKIIQGSAITALNSFVASDVMSIEASGVTAFVEGSGTILVRCRRNNPNAY